MGDWLTQYRNRDEFVADAEVARRHGFQPGQNPTERWGAAVFGPAFPIVDNVGPWATREQDLLVFDIPLYSDSDADHFGYSTVDEQTTTLYRDGREVGVISTGSDPASLPAVGSFSVPAEAGTYRLEASASRSVSAFSTRITAAWTFRSATTTGEQPLPLLAVRFDPALDNRNQAPTGPFQLPVWVQRQAGAQQAPLASLTVHASYDDGATWRPVPVTGSGSRQTVHLIHPPGAGYVSLRTTATDTAGGSVEQTITHAYAIRSSDPDVPVVQVVSLIA